MKANIQHAFGPWIFYTWGGGGIAMYFNDLTVNVKYNNLAGCMKTKHLYIILNIERNISLGLQTIISMI